MLAFAACRKGLKLLLTISRENLFRLFKYSVYAALTLNVYLFFAEEWAATAHRFADGVAMSDIIEGFAASIDTAAWVVLLLMFELETYVLDDEQFTPRTTWTLHGLRAVRGVNCSASTTLRKANIGVRLTASSRTRALHPPAAVSNWHPRL